MKKYLKMKSLCILCLGSFVLLATNEPISACAATQSKIGCVADYDEMYAEIDQLIEGVDKEELLQDAMNDAVDEQVSMKLEQSMVADVEFIPVEGEENIAFDIHQTVQKVGEITNSNGETSALYVAAAVATEPKLEMNFNEKYGIVAHVFVYWIDNLGVNNELYSIEVWWDVNGQAVRNRSVEYGVMDVLGYVFTDSETISININDYSKNVSGKYYGFVVGCSSSIEVVDQGTVKCTMHSSFLP